MFTSQKSEELVIPGMKKGSSIPPHHENNTTLYCYFKHFPEKTKVKISIYEKQGVYGFRENKLVSGKTDIVMERIEGTKIF